jgi:serine/threonine-protein kinase
MSSKDSTPLLFAGRYQLQRPIGSGRTSTVWRAWDETLDRTVAVKVVNVSLLPYAELCARLLTETRTAAGLTHPGLPFIYDFGEASVPGGSEAPYIVMEHLEGESLAARLARGPLPADQAYRVCAVVARALATAHVAGLVHRHVRPTKIFLTESGVKVLGVGTSQAVNDFPVGSAPGPDRLHASPYTAPEQLNESAVTAAADVYALGIVLAEALTGRLPSEEALPADVPDDISRLCDRCGAADPGARPTAAQMADILAAPVSAKTPAATTVIAQTSQADPPIPVKTTVRPPVTAARKPRRLDRIAIAAAPIALVLLLLGASGFVLDSPHSSGTKTPLALPSSDSATVTTEPTTEPTALEPTALEPTQEPAPAPTARAPVPTRTSAPSQAPPRPTRTATPRPPRPTEQPTQISPEQALNQVRQSVVEGVNAGEIRRDVGQDLDNVVSNLLRDLAGGQAADLARRVGEIRNKIATRFREGGITQNRANTLISLLPTV